ncbi:MAG: cobalamin biosynthesis protein CbiX [Opitutales bacterium]|nr:cobalamin biosynthesis protein CbiX [Opitutales bacterium]
MEYLLIDNGSLQAASYRNLQAVAAALGRRVGVRVHPVSLLHSRKIDPAELGGMRAWTFEPFVRERIAAGVRTFGILPFFFGPTGAITRYLPERLEALRARHGPFGVVRAPFLFDGDAGLDRAVAEIVADNVRRCARKKGLRRPPVVLVDHGSPLAAVACVRNYIAGQLSVLLGPKEVARVGAASMERREGAEYEFNEPLLERRLRSPGYDSGDVVVAMLFLSPGRHAGPGGDVAAICTAAAADQPALRCHMTDLVGTRPGIVDLLSERFAALQSRPVTL